MKLRLPLSLVALALSAQVLATPPSPVDVGDAGSFGNPVTWLGLIQTGALILAPDCQSLTPPPGARDRCVALNPPGQQTAAAFVDLGRMTLPKNSTDSLLCHWITPVAGYRLFNPTPEPVTGSFRANASYRFESVVLQDPSLVNPATGQPFAGAIDVFVPMAAESSTLAPGEAQQRSIRGSRVCIAGLISERSLIQDHGLSAAQAKRFFKEPITIRAGVSAAGNYLSSAQVLFGTRFAGDKR